MRSAVTVVNYWHKQYCFNSLSKLRYVTYDDFKYFLINHVNENREFIVVESLLIKTSTPHNSRDLDVPIYYFKLKNDYQRTILLCVYKNHIYIYYHSQPGVRILPPPHTNPSGCVCCLLSTGVFLLLLQTPQRE